MSTKTYIPTDAEVLAYMKAKLAEVHQVSRYGAVSISLFGNEGSETNIHMHADLGSGALMIRGDTLSKCTARVRAEYGKEAQARKLRDAAMKMIDEAEALETGK